jgi:hypothetical protein
MLMPLPPRIEKSAYPIPSKRDVLVLGIFFAAPFIIGTFMFNAYQKYAYVYLADLQGMSMLFIGLFMAFVVLSVISLKEFHRRLYRMYNTAKGIFWLSLFLLIPVLWIVREGLSGTNAQHFNEIIIRGSIAALAYVCIATFGIALLAYVLERLTKQKS